MRQLPLNLRDITQLTTLHPGVLVSTGSTRDINVGFGTKISVAGSRPNQNLFLMDGGDANDALNNTPAGAPGAVTGVETIKEFRVATNTMSAEFGRVAGGVFNMVTKSGTNEFHGSAFWFHRNDNFDTRNFFDAEKPEFKRNQFGFTFGGPIVQDKTFFFSSYEGLRESKGITQITSVPGRVIRQAQPGDPIFFPATGNTEILDPDVIPLLDLYPMPTGGEVEPGTNVEEFRGILDRTADEDFFTIRLDHRFSESDSIFGRYMFTDSEFVVPVLFPDFPNVAENRRQLLTIGETHVFSPTVINEFRFGINRSTPQEGPGPNRDVALRFIDGRELVGALRVRAQRGFPVPLTEAGTDRTTPKLFFNTTFQASDNLWITRGRHSMKMGVLFERFRFNGNSESRTRGRLEFRNLERLVRDEPRRIEGASARSDFARSYRMSLLGFYFQDDIRLNPRLTLFAGLRYEFVTTPTEENGKVSNVTDFTDPAAVIIVGDERFADPAAGVECCRDLFDNPTTSNFAPRIGLAWDVLGNSKTVVRSGFGIFYEQPLFHVFRNPIFRTLPFVERARIDVPGDTVASLPVDPALFVVSGAQRTEAFQFDLNPTYVMQYNLNIQQDLGWDTVVTLGYLGSRGVNLFGQGDTNLALPCGPSPFTTQFCTRPGQDFPAPVDGDTDVLDPEDNRRNPNFGRMRTIFQGFNSWYNAFTLGIRKQPSHGLTFQAAYTWSKCLDERSGSGGRQEQRFGQARAFDPFNRELDKARCDFDVRNSLVVNHIYDLPFGPGRALGGNSTGALAHFLEGWQLAGILTIRSGIPFNPFMSGDPDFDGSDDNVARPNLIGDPNSGTCANNGDPVGTPNCWFNPAAFGFPGFGFRGSLPRNFLTGPGLASYDFSIIKRTSINERAQVEFRAEFFNIFNRVNLNPPTNTEDGALIMTDDGDLVPSGAAISERSGTATTSREIQFGIKIIF